MSGNYVMNWNADCVEAVAYITALNTLYGYITFEIVVRTRIHFSSALSRSSQLAKRALPSNAQGACRPFLTVELCQMTWRVHGETGVKKREIIHLISCVGNESEQTIRRHQPALGCLWMAFYFYNYDATCIYVRMHVKFLTLYTLYCMPLQKLARPA